VRLLLASRSPQRRALLRQLGILFRTIVSDHEEDVHDGDPVCTVERNARGKARDVLCRTRLGAGELVLGVDTVVVVDDAVLGKASGEREAARFLRLLAGRSHVVYSGLYLCSRRRELMTHAVTSVRFRPLDAAAIGDYVACGEWRERAGAYAIQGVGSALVERIEGDYFNVVGLPVPSLVAALASFGVLPFSWLPRVGPAD
jgi:septum formation protein